MDLSAHRQNVARALLALESSIARLIDALSHSSDLAIVDGNAPGRSAIRRVCDAYSTIDYRMQDDVNQSPVCLGVIGVEADILKRAQSVNAAKAQFKHVSSALQGMRVRIPVKEASSPTKAVPLIRVILRNIQRSDVNLLAAYRKIPILGAPPSTVSYTRANTRSVYRKTIEEIADLLENVHSPAAIADRELLGSLDRRVMHLALVKHRYPNIRANVLYARLDSKGRGRIQLPAELPLLYAVGRGTSLPEIHFPPQPDGSTKPKRSRESKLEAQPFLQSLPVHRYSNG